MLQINKLKQTLLYSAFLIGLLAAFPATAEDDNPAESCKNAADLFGEGDIEGALEEARWCVTQFEKIKQNATSSFFKDEIGDFKAGELSSQSIMGMTVTEREYSNDSGSIRVSLTGASSEAAGNPFAVFAAMGMQATQGEKIRIQRRSAVVTKEGSTNKIIVTLKSGGILTFESNNIDKEDILGFAKQFPVADLDDSSK